MIKIRNLTVVRNGQRILSNINLDLPNTGVVSVIGSSGSGKTTLLNAIAGLIDFEGEISIDNASLKILNDDQLGHLRLKDIGFVYQDFKLFEDETVEQNILLPYSSLLNSSKEEQKRKLKDICCAVDFNKKTSIKANKLSGGEKQKVAIGRAIVNAPKILLADEPTGSLDNLSSEHIVKTINKLGNSMLVIVVSHNPHLFDDRAVKIIKLRDGKIEYEKDINRSLERGEILTKQISKEHSQNKLSLRFLFSHIFKKIQRKKFRSFISLFAMSLGLVGFGFSLNLTNSIASNIKSTFASVIDEQRILITQKEKDNNSKTRYSVSVSEARNIKNEYNTYFEDIGVNYLANFEEYFIDTNEAVLDKSKLKYVLEGINARSINEFRWMYFINTAQYPFTYKNLQNDEVVLALSIEMVNSICYEYRIERSVESLSEYLKLHSIPITFYFENLSWQFSFDFTVNMVGFTLENKGAIYHSNHLWNQHIFEEVMKFPASENLTGILDKPWSLRKISYLQIKENIKEDFLSKSLKDISLNEYIFDTGLDIYFPYKKLNPMVPYHNKIMIFKNNLSGILPIYSSYIQETYNMLSNPIYGSYGEYFIYPEIMMMGFAQETYFSSDENQLYQVIDSKTSFDNSGANLDSLPKNVLSAHYSDSMGDGIIFNPLTKEEQIDFQLNNYSEIVVSSALAKTLFGSTNVIGKELFISSCKTTLNNEQNLRTFTNTKLVIKGVKYSSKNLIFHNPEWSIIFFMTKLGVSRFELDTNTMSFEIPNKQFKEQIIEDFNKKNSPFPFLVASDPMKSINSGVDEICSFLEIALVCFSTFAIVISILLLAMTNYLFIIENKRDFGLIRCVGLSKKESLKLLFANSGIYGLIAFTMSTIELLVVSILINAEIGIILGGNSAFSFNPIAIVVMLILSMSISLISSFVFSRKISKITPLEALKA